MSDIFQKSCYTSRSTGYKYRTLSTNTGERKRRDSLEDNTFDRKLKELQQEITSRVVNQVNLAQVARDSIEDKFNKIDAKINSMLELQDTVTSLRKNLHVAESSLAEMLCKVDKMEADVATNEACSLNSKKSSSPSTDPILEEKEIAETTFTHL